MLGQLHRVCNAGNSGGRDVLAGGDEMRFVLQLSQLVCLRVYYKYKFHVSICIRLG
jgi:hypothetical protein